MEDSDQPSGGRQVPKRTQHACQRCRSLKTRCLPTQQPGTCQRCFLAKRECVWSDPPQRPKKTRGPSRIAQFEQKIDGLVATLTNANRSTSQDQRPRSDAPATSTYFTARADPPDQYFKSGAALPLRHPGDWLPTPSSFEVRHEGDPETEGTPSRLAQDAEPTQQYMEKLREIHSFGDDDDISQPPRGSSKGHSRCEKMIDNSMVKQLLSSGCAEELLQEYRSMLESFPFVPIAPHVNAQQLSLRKPMLFLAILTVASWKDHTRQMALDAVYRQELADRTIIRPQRTLSLVQSIIVYLSRYHFVFSHKTQQTFSLLQLGLGLALDIGLHQKNRRTFAVPGHPSLNAPSPIEQRERQRTFLGCYFLSSAISVSLVKPNMLKYIDYMAECERRLRQDREFASDETLGRLISLRRIDDQIHESFNSEEVIDLPFNDTRITMNLRFLESQLEDWRRNNSASFGNRVLDIALIFTDLQLHAIGLRSPPADSQNQPSNNTQLNALLATLEAGKQFFDILLALPAAEYHLLSFADWMRLPHSVVTVAQLCIPSNAHTATRWDTKAAQERVRLDLYLESLCYRMQGLSTYDQVKQPHHDFWWAMRMILDLTRTWYCRKIRQAEVASSSQATPHTHSTPGTGQSLTQASSAVSEISPLPTLGERLIDPCINMMNMDAGNIADSGDSNDPFAFMRNMDFDMDQFLDLGIWGHETYEGMGFGGGPMQF